MSVGEFAVCGLIMVLVIGLAVGFIAGYECVKYQR